MSKFPDKKSRKLYQRDGGPNDQVGSSSEGRGWAGLYIRAKRPGGHILVEHPDGFVDHHIYDTEEHLRSAWANFEKALENHEPLEEDWLIQEPSRGFTYVNKAGAPSPAVEVPNREAAVEYVKSRMAAEGHWSDVWIVNERGEALLYEMPPD